MLGWWLTLFLTTSSSAQQTDEVPRFEKETDKQILDAISDQKRYDYRMRPNKTTDVNVTVIILSLSSPDESSLKYEVEFLLEQRWEDSRLRWDGRLRYLNGLSHQGALWTPDIYFIKHGDFKQPLAQVHMALRVHPNGTVTYITRRSMILNCQGNLQIFPFDNPKCPFAIESVSHESSELELRWERGGVIRASSLRHHNAYLVKNETGPCDSHHTWRGNYSCLRVLLVFTRDKTFYFSTVFGPGVVLVTSSFISFWLEVGAVPARVMIGVTTMLNFCTTTNSFRSTLPVVSNLTAMNLWDGVCMFFIYASMLEFIIVNCLHRRRQIQRPGSGVLKDDNSNEREGGRAPLFGALQRKIGGRNPRTLSKDIDRVSKILFPLAFGLFVAGYFLTYAVVKPAHPENWELLSNGYAD